MPDYEMNKKCVRDLFEAIDSKNKEKFMECEHPDFALTFPGYDKVLDSEGHWQMAGMHGTAYSDMKHIPEEQYAEGDYVVTFGHITGTNDGPYHGKPATKNAINIRFVTICKMKEGKIVSIDSMFDSMAEYEQLYGKLS